MTDDPDQPEWLKFGVAAALSKQYSQDQREFLSLLATMLQAAMPGSAETKMRGGLFSKKTLQAVSANLGEYRYTLEDPGHGPLRATRTRIVRGIALKTEEIPVEDWVRELGACLDETARASAAAREALSRLVG